MRTSEPLSICFLATFSRRELQRSRHCWPGHCLRFAHAQKGRLCAFPRARVCKAASCFVRSRQHQTAPAQPTGASQQPAWDAELYCSSERAAVLALEAFQAPAAAQPGGEPAGSASAETSHHVLFSDSKGFACQMTVPRLQTPASAVVSRWQPHAGRCGPQHSVVCRLSLEIPAEKHPVNFVSTKGRGDCIRELTLKALHACCCRYQSATPIRPGQAWQQVSRLERRLVQRLWMTKPWNYALQAGTGPLLGAGAGQRPLLHRRWRHRAALVGGADRHESSL